MHVNKSSSGAGGRVGITIRTIEGEEINLALCLEFTVLNNEVEYKAIFAGMKLALECGAKRLIIFTDSQLVFGQIEGNYEAREESMVRYLTKVKELRRQFKSLVINQVP